MKTYVSWGGGLPLMTLIPLPCQLLQCFSSNSLAKSEATERGGGHAQYDRYFLCIPLHSYETHHASSALNVRYPMKQTSSKVEQRTSPCTRMWGNGPRHPCYFHVLSRFWGCCWMVAVWRSNFRVVYFRLMVVNSASVRVSIVVLECFVAF